MIKVTLCYPNTADIAFDSEYYIHSHIPMVSDTCGEALKRVEVDLGLAGRKPEEQAPYVAIAHLIFDSIEAYENAFVANLDKFTADVPNYSNTRPIFQLSKVCDLKLA